MSDKSVRASLTRFFAEQCYLSADDLRSDEPLFSSGTLSSLDFIDLIAFLEREYRLKVEPDAASFENFDSIQRIEAYIAKRGG